MGFLTAAEGVVARAMAQAMAPPPPPDITRWAEQNVVFDERSPLPGPFSIARFLFLREIHEVLSPEHPAREVTVVGSAQWGKTVGIIQPTLAAWHEYCALDSLVVHPTYPAAKDWVTTKWLPMRRQAPGLRRVFGDGRSGDNADSLFNQETLNRNGSLKVASAGSPADLTGTTRRLVIMDDLSKWDMTDKGDPEQLAISRASGFEDAKLLRVSTPTVKGECRITAAWERSDQRLYHVPCPHCGAMQPLTWENFRRNLNPENLQAAHFSCIECGAVIGHGEKEAMVAKGRWIATRPGGDHPGFHLWRAYVAQRDWASIAVEYAQVMGWVGLTAEQVREDEARRNVAARTEQVFWNDVLGLPFEQASAGPDWEALRDRTEKAEPPDLPLPRGLVPSAGVLLTAGVDCQADRIEVTVVAFGRNYSRWVIDHLVIPHHIGDEEGRAALTALVKATWRTELGLRLGLDMMAVDESGFTEDVRAWAKAHPWTKVILFKGASSAQGAILRPQHDRKATGGALRVQKRGWMLNVSQMKADFYTWLAKTDPAERGFIRFARALGDEFYRQITSEVRVLKRAGSGVMVARWDLVEPSRRNECLDCMIYAEGAARKLGWTVKTDADWDRLADQRAGPPEGGQPDLFDARQTSLSARAMPAGPAAPKDQGTAAPPPAPRQPAPAPADANWIPKRDRWI